MGGALILVAIAISTLLWADLGNRYIWVVLAVTFVFGIIGWVDDYKKLVKQDPKGLIARYKYFWQSACALVIAIYLYKTASPVETALIVPFFKSVAIPLGVVSYVLLTYFVIVGTSNAVNLTDGLDGLAGGILLIAFAAYGMIAFGQGKMDLAVFCGVIIGALLAFYGLIFIRLAFLWAIQGPCL